LAPPLCEAPAEPEGAPEGTLPADDGLPPPCVDSAPLLCVTLTEPEVSPPPEIVASPEEDAVDVMELGGTDPPTSPELVVGAGAVSVEPVADAEVAVPVLPGCAGEVVRVSDAVGFGLAEPPFEALLKVFWDDPLGEAGPIVTVTPPAVTVVLPVAVGSGIVLDPIVIPLGPRVRVCELITMVELLPPIVNVLLPITTSVDESVPAEELVCGGKDGPEVIGTGSSVNVIPPEVIVTGPVTVGSGNVCDPIVIPLFPIVAVCVPIVMMDGVGPMTTVLPPMTISVLEGAAVVSIPDPDGPGPPTVADEAIVVSLLVPGEDPPAATEDLDVTGSTLL
jgi:hypothetical protein